MSGDRKGIIKIWDVKLKKEIKTLEKQKGSIK